MLLEFMKTKVQADLIHFAYYYINLYNIILTYIIRRNRKNIAFLLGNFMTWFLPF